MDVLEEYKLLHAEVGNGAGAVLVAVLLNELCEHLSGLRNDIAELDRDRLIKLPRLTQHSI